MRFSGPFNLDSDSFLAAPPLTGNWFESALWNSGKVMESCLYKTGDKRSSVPGSSTGPSSVSNITRDDLPISKTGHEKYNLAYDKLLYEFYEPFLGLYKYNLISFALWIRSLQSRVLPLPPQIRPWSLLTAESLLAVVSGLANIKWSSCSTFCDQYQCFLALAWRDES